MKKIFFFEAKLTDTGELPDWYQIFPDGEFDWEGEKLFVDGQSLFLIVDDLLKNKVDLVIDYEHQTMLNKQAPAAGWIKQPISDNLKYVPGTGIEAKIIWTDKAKKYLTAGEYRYYSPVFKTEQNGRVCRLHSIALTNTPRFKHLKPLIAKKEQDMNKEAQAKLLQALGLQDSATDQDILSAIDNLKAANKQTKTEDKPKIAKAILDALELSETADQSEVIATIHAAKQTTKTANQNVETELAALKAKVLEQEAQTVVTAALKAGKITAEQTEWALNYAKTDGTGFETFIAKAPVVVPVTDLPKQKEKKDGEFSEATLKVAKLMGVSKDDLKKYSKPNESE